MSTDRFSFDYGEDLFSNWPITHSEEPAQLTADGDFLFWKTPGTVHRFAIGEGAILCTEPPTMRGDVNADKDLDIADALYLLRFLFRDGRAPHCFDAADANDDGFLDIADAMYLLAFLFGDGPPPHHTGPRCDP